MNTTRKICSAASLTAVLALAGCWDDDEADAPVAAAVVPDSAGVSGAAFVAYLLTLSSSDESSEPALIKESFVVPADETGERQVL